METERVWPVQRRAVLSALVAGYLPALVVLGLVVLVRWRWKIPIGDMTRDPAAVMHWPFYIGAVSNLGVLAWCAAATICYYSYALLRKRAEAREMRLLLLFSGIITTVLLFDDLYQFHEVVYPTFLHIPEQVTFGVYLIGMLAYLIRFRATIARTPFLLMPAPFVLFAMSQVVDQFHLGQMGLRAPYLWEDGSKFLGIVGWLAYLATVSWEQTRGTAAA